MKISVLESNADILRELGSRIKDIRISIPLTQKELAEKTGLSLRTVAHMETGKATNTDSLIRVMRVLGLLNGLDVCFPEQEPRPSDLMQLGKKRERATSPSKRTKTTSWVWGEDK